MMSLKSQWILARLQQNSMEEATNHCKNLRFAPRVLSSFHSAAPSFNEAKNGKLPF